MMRQLRFIRFIFIALISFLFITSAVFLRRTIAVLLCGVLSFNSTICYSFLGNYGKADAAIPRSSAVVTSKDFSVVQKDEQKITDCFLGVCVNIPKSPIPIPGIPSGNPIDIAKTALIKEIGEAVGVGSPLLLDQKTAYPDVSDQVKDFHPQKLTITSAEDLQKPLPAGDYSIDVIAYCTQFSIHAPGQGLPYKLAPLQGKQAPAISALLSRGTLQGIAPATLNANAWRIQAGLPLKQWPSQDQALIHKLIPEYEKGLEGDYLQQIENTYNQFRLVPGIPSLNDLLSQSGAPGQIVLQLRQARQTLADQTISAERLPDLLYEPTGDGLPRVLPASKDSSPSPWAEIKPGIFARFTVIEGNLGRNLFEFRVTPKAIAAIKNSTTVAMKGLNKNLRISSSTTNAPTLSTINTTGYEGIPISQGAQILIAAIPTIPTPCGDKEIQINYDPNNTGVISGYHHYEVKTMICSTLLSDCTVDNVFTLMESNAQYIAPVEYSKPVKNCMLSTVNIPVLGEGTILTVVDEKAHSVTNFTKKDHPLHPGKVVRTVVEENKSVIVKTVGDGTGWFPSLNESKAKDLWGNIDNQLKDHFNHIY